MPSFSSIFRHRRTDTVRSPDDKKAKKKRRSLFFFSDPGEPNRRVSNNAAVGNAPGSRRALRASTASVPELPSLPIYQTFSGGTSLSAAADDISGEGGPTSQRRARRMATVADFHSGRPGTEQPDRDSVSRASNPPVYDRAAEFARYYQSILPEFPTWDDEEPASKNKSQPTSPLDLHDRGQNEPLPFPERDPARLNSRSNHRPESDVSQPPPPALTSSPTPASRQSRPSPKQHVEVSSGEPTDSQPPTPHPASQTTPSPPPSYTSEHSTAGLKLCTDLLVEQLRKALAAQQHGGDGGGTGTDADTDTDTAPDPNAGPGHTPGDDDTPETQSQTSGNENSPNENSPNPPPSPQEPIRLLIQAYEGLLSSCRRGVLPREASGDGEARGQASRPCNMSGDEDSLSRERALAVGVVPVLEHWVGALYAVCDGVGVSDRDETG